MRRDIDLIRKLLFAIENHPHGFAPSEVHLDGFDDEQIGYHLFLMLDAGLIFGEDVSDRGSQSPQGLATSLTWAGHEFIDSARSDTVWNKAKKMVGEKIGSTTFSVVSGYLQHLATSALGFGISPTSGSSS